jgi:hypothetical protein
MARGVGMKYLVCDTEGQLQERDEEGGQLAIINKEVGPEGLAAVRIRTGTFVGLIAGYVNDCGLLFPERYPRNVVGSCLLGALGANAQPYAGPVVLTGWDDTMDDIEIRDVSDNLVAAVRQIHGDIRVALGLDAGPSSLDARVSWLATMVELAEFVRESATPSIELITDPAEVRSMLRGGGR